MGVSTGGAADAGVLGFAGVTVGGVALGATGVLGGDGEAHAVIIKVMIVRHNTRYETLFLISNPLFRRKMSYMMQEWEKSNPARTKTQSGRD